MVYLVEFVLSLINIWITACAYHTLRIKSVSELKQIG